MNQNPFEDILKKIRDLDQQNAANNGQQGASSKGQQDTGSTEQGRYTQ